MNLRSSARADTGEVKESNQDAMVCLYRLVAVADGMGGTSCGDTA
jgi:serine/threonine protein phosphatase PrpC